MSPTDCSDETNRLKIARRLGSAMTSNTVSTLFIYFYSHILVKEYNEASEIFSARENDAAPWPRVGLRDCWRLFGRQEQAPVEGKCLRVIQYAGNLLACGIEGQHVCRRGSRFAIG